mgnify:CR=1 FL=1
MRERESERAPRHNDKVERNHRENQKRFYSLHRFYSLQDFTKQLAVHNRRSNNFPMRSLGWLSSAEFSVQYVWQTYSSTILEFRMQKLFLLSKIVILVCCF